LGSITARLPELETQVARLKAAMEKRERAIKTPIVEEDSLNELHILIVDDIPFMRGFIKNCVKMCFPNCIVDMAEDGKAAIQEIQTKSFSIILCDWELPDIKGDKILKWVREESPAKDVPFIMVTGNSEKEDILRVISLGVTDYVVKPLSCEILAQKIRVALRPKR
jgi:DNA-binding response OmpR family regulator